MDMRDDRSTVDLCIPPGAWRQGNREKSILLRFATTGDKKFSDGDRRSTQYKKYGSSNFGGVTSRKRKVSSYRNLDSFHSADPEKEDINVKVDLHQVPRAHRSVRHMPSHYTSVSERTSHQECDSDSDEDENILSAGGKKIRMRMYADSIQGSWQRVNSSPKAKPKRAWGRSHRHSGAANEAEEDGTYFSENSSNNEEPRVEKVPSRFKIWNPIAESMAKEAELAERSTGYRPSFQRGLFPNDLRRRISSNQYTSRHVHVSKSTDVDLRKKLQKMRQKDSKSSHRSPLLISVKNNHDDSSDSSL